jgi:hypothetical protein
MQVPSGMTMTPQVPAIVPRPAIDSMSKVTSISSARRIGVDDPPGMTALSRFPSRRPPAMSWMKLRRFALAGSS